MSTDTYLLRRFGPPVAVRTAALLALLAIAPLTAIADTPSAPAQVTRTAKVSLADLDLATPEGARVARKRLHATALRLCSQVADYEDLSHQANFVACVDAALAAALRQIQGPSVASVAKSHDTPR
jgi:UrcA family protein